MHHELVQMLDSTHRNPWRELLEDVNFPWAEISPIEALRSHDVILTRNAEKGPHAFTIYVRREGNHWEYTDYWPHKEWPGIAAVACGGMNAPTIDRFSRRGVRCYVPPPEFVIPEDRSAFLGNSAGMDFAVPVWSVVTDGDVRVTLQRYSWDRKKLPEPWKCYAVVRRDGNELTVDYVRPHAPHRSFSRTYPRPVGTSEVPDFYAEVVKTLYLQANASEGARRLELPGPEIMPHCNPAEVYDMCWRGLYELLSGD